MEQEFSTLVETAKRLALLAETLERRSDAAVQEQQQAVQVLEQALSRVRGDLGQVLDSAGTRVGQLVQQGLDSSLGQGAEHYERVVATASSRLGGATQTLAQAQEAVAAGTRKAVILAYAAVAGAMALLVIGGAILLNFEYRQYQQARERTAAAQLRAELAEAFTRIGVTSCAGTPCIQLDKDAPRWGNKSDYLLIRRFPDEKPR
ncbi:hypothetical protein [Pseudomonas sp. CGJS7]|uniref:hypothetical protein n=1 Tax=Pseudomonas sp. CGJS7 TaxID=3109348 RepID=UPI00300B305E